MAAISPPASPPAKKPQSPQSQSPGKEGNNLTFGQRWQDAGKAKRPSLANVGDPSGGRRQSSIAFNTGPAEDTIRRESTSKVPTIASLNRRKSSPPPPQTYQRGVSFDTFDNKNATDLSFTLSYKHKAYHNSRRSRTFLCGTDQKDYSDFALEWLLEELVDDGDEIVCLRVVEKDSRIASDSSVEHGRYKDEAKKLLETVIKKNSQEDKAISLIMELAVGKVEAIIQRMIQIYEPAVLIVGTRGRNLGGMQGLLPGSVSKYCLQQSPIPVIVVRPSTKRLKKKKKRSMDPDRASYGNILDQAKTRGGSHVLDRNNAYSVMGPLPEATEQEAAAVAKAIGLPRNYKQHARGGSLSRITSGKSDSSGGDPDGPPVEGFLPAGYLRAARPLRADVALKDPMIAALGNEDWDDFDKKVAEKEKAEHIDSAVDEEGESLPLPKSMDARRSSHGPKPDWLSDILKQPEKPRSRSRSHNRSLSG